jgi:predicted RecA/RadA family phage recombinase
LNMEENFGAACDIIMIPAPRRVQRGELILINKLCGVAKRQAEEGEEVEVMVEGCFDFPKAYCRFALGDPAYWDASDKKVTDIAQGNARIGVVVGAAPESAEIVRVRLHGFIA